MYIFKVGCCGMTDNGYKDWNTNIYFHCNKSSPSSEKCGVPPSCCIHFKVCIFLALSAPKTELSQKN